MGLYIGPWSNTGRLEGQGKIRYANGAVLYKAGHRADTPGTQSLIALIGALCPSTLLMVSASRTMSLPLDSLTAVS
jgi:hypothetical protein